MLYYLLHKTSLWDKPGISNGQRNVRILFVVLVFYLIMHSITFECQKVSLVCKIIYNYFWWIVAADILLCACEYKLFYGRSLINELKDHETDVFDSTTHKYIKKESSKPALEDKSRENNSGISQNI